MTAAPVLGLPATDLSRLRLRVGKLAENRPAVYRMRDATGRVIYVGKAKRLRARLMTYFRAHYPEDKGARILHAAADIEWEYVPSEFAAYLRELRQIQRFRPPLNHQLNRTRRMVLVRLSGGAAPRLSSGTGATRDAARCYGPFASAGRVAEGLRILNDLLGLRDCAATMPIVYAGQMELFGGGGRAACMRHDFGTCQGPCAGLVTEEAYLAAVERAVDFLEGRAIAPIDRVVSVMQEAATAEDYERAARWREKFEALEWLLTATTRARAARALLTFVYRDPGTYGDDRAYLVRAGLVRAHYPWPTTPLEQEAFRAVVAAELEEPEPPVTSLATGSLDEILLLMSWFRRHPDALRRTTPLEEWNAPV